ncbi:MAG: DinB family protein [Planctomycetota bacterium]|nr:MAG: DinB family protein [Planctomycetota bacterium]
MTTATRTCAADTIVPPCRLALGLFEKALADIPAERFARKPEGVNTNHPAWIIGHLSVYTDNVLEMIGRGELADPAGAKKDLFDANTECRDDADGSIYPPKDELVASFVKRFNTALDALAGADDATLAQPNTFFAQEAIPTVGGLCNFLLAHHMMMHFGQVSAWRRMMGLGPVM